MQGEDGASMSGAEYNPQSLAEQLRRAVDDSAGIAAVGRSSPQSSPQGATAGEAALADLIEEMMDESLAQNASLDRLASIPRVFLYYSSRLSGKKGASSRLSLQGWKMLLSDCGQLRSQSEQRVADMTHVRAVAAQAREGSHGAASGQLGQSGFVLALAMITVSRLPPVLRKQLTNAESSSSTSSDSGGGPARGTLLEAAARLNAMLADAKELQDAVDASSLLDPAAVRVIGEHEKDLARLFYHRAILMGSTGLALDGAVAVAKDCELFPRLLSKESVQREFEAVASGGKSVRYSDFVELFGRLALVAYSGSEFADALPDAASKVNAALTAFEGSEALDSFHREERERGVDILAAVRAADSRASSPSARSRGSPQDAAALSLRSSRASSPGDRTGDRYSGEGPPGAASSAESKQKRSRRAARRRASVTMHALEVQARHDAAAGQAGESDANLDLDQGRSGGAADSSLSAGMLPKSQPGSETSSVLSRASRPVSGPGELQPAAPQHNFASVAADKPRAGQAGDAQGSSLASSMSASPTRASLEADRMQLARDLDARANPPGPGPQLEQPFDYPPSSHENAGVAPVDRSLGASVGLSKRSGVAESLSLAAPGSSVSVDGAQARGPLDSMRSPPRSPRHSRGESGRSSRPQHSSRVDDQLVAGVTQQLQAVAHRAHDAFFFYCRIDDPANRGEMSPRNFVRLLRDAGFFEPSTGLTVHEVQLQLVIMARNRSHHRDERQWARDDKLDASDAADARTSRSSRVGAGQGQPSKQFSSRGSIRSGTVGSRRGSVSRASSVGSGKRGRRGSIIGGAASQLASEAVLDSDGFVEAVVRCCELRRQHAAKRNRRQQASSSLSQPQAAFDFSRQLLLEDIAPLGEVASGYEQMLQRVESAAVVQNMRRSRKLLSRLFTYFCDARKGDDTSQVLRLPQLVKLCIDCEISPRLISRSEIEAVFYHVARRHGTDATTGGGPLRGVTGTSVGGYRRASITQAERQQETGGDGTGERGMDASYVTFPAFVECLGVFALQGLAQPFMHRMYPRPENKVEGMILWIRSSDVLRKIQSEDHQRGYGRKSGRKLSKRAAAGEVVPADIDTYSKLVAQIRPELRPSAGGSNGGRVRRSSVFAGLMASKEEQGLLLERAKDEYAERGGVGMDRVAGGSAEDLGHVDQSTARSFRFGEGQNSVDEGSQDVHSNAGSDVPDGRGTTGSSSRPPPPPPPRRGGRAEQPATEGLSAAATSEDDLPGRQAAAAPLDRDTAPAVAVALRILAAALNASPHSSSVAPGGDEVQNVIQPARKDIESAIRAVSAASTDPEHGLPHDVAAIAASAANTVAQERGVSGGAISDPSSRDGEGSVSAEKLLRIARALETVAQGPTPHVSPSRNREANQGDDLGESIGSLSQLEDSKRSTGYTSAHRGLAPAPQHISARAVHQQGQSLLVTPSRSPGQVSGYQRSYASPQRQHPGNQGSSRSDAAERNMQSGLRSSRSSARAPSIQPEQQAPVPVEVPSGHDGVLEWLQSAPLARDDDEKSRRLQLIRSVRENAMRASQEVAFKENLGHTGAAWAGGLRRGLPTTPSSRRKHTAGTPASAHVVSHPYEPVGSRSHVVDASTASGGAGGAVLDFRGVVEHVHRAERGRAWKQTQDWIRTQRVDLSGASGFSGRRTTPRGPRLVTDSLALSRSGKKELKASQAWGRKDDGGGDDDWIAAQSRLEIAKEAELAASKRSTGMTPVPPPLWASAHGSGAHVPPVRLEDTLRSEASHSLGDPALAGTKRSPTKPRSFALRALARAKERDGVLFSSVASQQGLHQDGPTANGKSPSAGGRPGAAEPGAPGGEVRVGQPEQTPEADNLGMSSAFELEQL